MNIVFLYIKLVVGTDSVSRKKMSNFDQGFVNGKANVPIHLTNGLLAAGSTQPPMQGMVVFRRGTNSTLNIRNKRSGVSGVPVYNFKYDNSDYFVDVVEMLNAKAELKDPAKVKLFKKGKLGSKDVSDEVNAVRNAFNFMSGFSVGGVVYENNMRDMAEYEKNIPFAVCVHGFMHVPTSKSFSHGEKVYAIPERDSELKDKKYTYPTLVTKDTLVNMSKYGTIMDSVTNANDVLELLGEEKIYLDSSNFYLGVVDDPIPGKQAIRIKLDVYNTN